MKSYKFTIDGNTFEVDIVQIEGNMAKIEVNGTTFNVEIHRAVQPAKTPVLVRPAVKDPQKMIEKKVGGARSSVKAPLPGIILRLLVKPGDEVKKDQKLFIMEAMKMENEIKADRDGVVTAIKVTEGQSVLQEEVIMEMD
ncbi:MAG: biotin/lipoyl-binding protein [Bacteroidales bacterium]|nr:biotin/lipoyl-binding protein [Bacteroidales bacterium]